MAGIEQEYSFSSDADLVRVWPRGKARNKLPDASERSASATGEITGTTTEPAASSLPLEVDNGHVEVADYRLRALSGLAEPAQELTLYWRLLSPTAKVLKLSLRLLDPNGNPYHWPDGREAVEDHFPLHQVALTPAWQPGELIQDIHTLPLPPALHADLQQSKSPTLLVIIYDSATALEEGRIESEFLASQVIDRTN